MSVRDAVRRIEAYGAGVPLPRGATRYIPIAADGDALIVVFVRMGGESLPWGVAWGQPGSEPQTLTAADARNRDLVAGMLADFTPAILKHLDHPDVGQRGVTSESPIDRMPLTQLWLLNGSHLEMLHYLNLRYTFARRGEASRVTMLNALGRAAGWAFRQAQLAGQTTVVDATAALRDAYVVAADDLRQQHLGFLLALLDPGSPPDERPARAEAAEQQSVSITLDPLVERDQLEPLVTEFTEARRAEDTAAMATATKRIDAVLSPELIHRFELVEAAIELLRADGRPTNPGTAKLIQESTRDRMREYVRLEERLLGHHGDERPFVPSPETDSLAPAAAAGYIRHSAAEERFMAALIHHDEELQDDAISAGDAFRGKIVDVEDISDSTRKKRPVWTIDSTAGGPMRLRRGSGVCVAGIPNRGGRVRSVDPLPGGGRRFEVEITEWKTARPTDPAFPGLPAAHDQTLIGDDLTLLAGNLGGISIRKMQRVWERDGPGAWLTNGNGAPPGRSRRAKGDVLAEVDVLLADT